MEIFPEDIDDFVSAEEAADYYNSKILELAGDGSMDETLNVQLLTIFNTVINDFNKAQNHALLIPIHPEFNQSLNVYVIVGENQGKFSIKQMEKSYLIIIDRNSFLTILMIVHYLSIKKSYTELFVSWLFLHFISNNKPFPCLTEFFYFELESHQHILSSLLYSIGQFIIFHELGHIYQKKYEHENFTNIRVLDVNQVLQLDKKYLHDLSFRTNGNSYHYYDDPVKKEFYLIIPKEKSFWMPELISDIFGCYAKLLVQSGGNPEEEHLNRLVDHLCIWQLVAFCLSWKVKIKGTVKKHEDTHPNFYVRFDVIIFHLEAIARNVANTWKSEQLTILHGHYDVLWSESLTNIISDSYDFIFYTIDGTGPNIDVGNVQSFSSSGTIPTRPGLFVNMENLMLLEMMRFMKKGSENDIAGTNMKWHHIILSFSEKQLLGGKKIILALAKELKKFELNF